MRGGGSFTSHVAGWTFLIPQLAFCRGWGGGGGVSFTPQLALFKEWGWGGGGGGGTPACPCGEKRGVEFPLHSQILYFQCDVESEHSRFFLR